MDDDFRRLGDPNSNVDFKQIVESASRVFRLGISLLLIGVGLYLLLDVYFTVSKFIETPNVLEPTLAAWESTLSATQSSDYAAPLGTSKDPVKSAAGFFSTLVAELGNGKLVRPLAGIIILFFFGILLKVALGLLGAGVSLLKQDNSPVKEQDDPSAKPSVHDRLAA